MLILIALAQVLLVTVEACNTSLVAQLDVITKARVSASSFIKGKEPFNIRLNGNSSWCYKASDHKPWIKIDFGQARVIEKIEMKNTKNVVKKFRVSYRLGKKTKPHYIKWFHGPSKEGGTKTVTFSQPFMAEAVTIFILETNSGWFSRKIACSQFAIYGCKVPPPTTTPPRINYCQNHTCEQICQNGLDRPLCSCYPGYKKNLTSGKCEDVDECRTGEDRCDVKTTDCYNIMGSYECKCNHKGLELHTFGKKCVDKNECATNNGGCNHKCINQEKTYRCECYSGYLLGKDNHSCIDINECANTSMNTCDINTTTCTNIPGDYKCSCLSGLKPTDASPKSSCEDINECEQSNGGCEEFCTNDYRTYNCSCRKTMRLDADRHSCYDINECKEGTHNCQQVCHNLIGSHYCDCKQGYNLNNDNKTCTDINECSPNSGRGPCEGTCKNTDGSYKCSCGKGLKLDDNGRTCKDIDECAERKDECNSATSTCENYHGGYLCRCKKGFYKVGTNKCVARYCPAILQPTNGLVSPPDCMSKNTKQYKDVCTFTCDKGFEPRGNSADRAFCDEFGQWNLLGKLALHCHRKHCRPVARIPNGYILPSTCEKTGAKYNESCHVYCNNGHFLKGNTNVTCQADQTYDGSFQDTECIKKKRITCPDDVYLTLPIGAKNMTLSLSTVSVKIDLEEVDSSPAGVLSGQFHFKPRTKSYPVKLFYKNPIFRSTDNSCEFHVKVTDREPPKILKCPSKDYYVTLEEEYEKVMWPEPKFSDNVGIAKVIQNMKNNQHLPQQVYYVFYSAIDEAGNMVTCRFFLHVRARYCSKQTLVGGDRATKHWFPATLGSLNVAIVCPAGTVFSFNITGGGVFRCNKGSWGVQGVPDCVDYVNKNGSCPVATRPVAHQYTKQVLCANCPKGTKGTSKGCTKCGIGYYQDKEGATECTKCPVGTTSKKNGSRDFIQCQAQCAPGTYSLTGFYDASGCHRCPKGSYQEEYGQSSCKLCPSENATTFVGAKSEDECIFPARISSIIPSEEITAKVGDTVSFDCIAEGNPPPFVGIKNATELAPASFRGRASQRPINPQKKYQSALRMVIFDVQTYDTATYKCSADNTRGNIGGKDERKIYIKVSY